MSLFYFLRHFSQGWQRDENENLFSFSASEPTGRNFISSKCRGFIQIALNSSDVPAQAGPSALLRV
jgi:hypothetical protein